MEKTKESCYKDALSEFSKFYAKYNDKSNKLTYIAKITSICAILHKNLPTFHFVGFYLVTSLLDTNSTPLEEKVLEIGPYQSPILATPRIGFGNGVCGTCWKEQKTIIENDVTVCKNYIACDGATLSEIVVPVWNEKKTEVIAVLDVDGQEKGLFDETDKKYLEEFVELIYK